jgi:Bifunctional DNA primase/polymerase, N-terminal
MSEAPSGYLARYGAKLIENGFVITPIRRGDKAPGPADWQKLPSTIEQLDKWLANGYSRSGVGIVTRHNPAVDIDTLDPTISAQMVEFTRQLVGPAPLRIGMAPKALLLFTCNAPFSKVLSARFRRPGAPRRTSVSRSSATASSSSRTTSTPTPASRTRGPTRPRTRC